MATSGRNADVRYNPAMTRRRHTVAALAFDGLAPFELAVACEVFGIDRSHLPGADPWYRFKVCAAGQGPLRAANGLFTLAAPYGLDDAARADTVIVPAGPREVAPEVLATLRRAHRRGARIMSGCTGASVLAAPGLPDGARTFMSPRTFARRFKATTGTTPLQWLLGQRVLLAQRLLETTDDSIELIADRCGLGSASNLRVHFQRIVGTSPAAYRRTFCPAE